ncbi:dynein heavy chain, cytoplasmic-like [Daphnia pulicaria]|uniref:dynein heavy chain, cytoplasmic-like n=1 Tax=Daphnia pulicaria TaxID=35523 RepID=UPI001EEB8B95|nr:dynein heavy chain, cytoplasmic-like [Daphnia pulicaria]
MDTDAVELGGQPQIRTIIHEICVTNQTMYLHPPLPEARTKIYDLMFDWQAIVTSLTRIQSTGYQVALDRPTPQTYRNLLTNMPDGPEVLAAASAACTAIEGRMKEVKVYVDDS